MRFLGVDPGSRRIGLAVGDDRTGVVSPLRIVAYDGVSRAADTLRDIAEDCEAAVIVIGLPLSEAGNETPACRRSHALAEALEALGLETRFQPEFLSSHEATGRAREIHRNPDDAVDDLAAQIILEDFIETVRRATGSRRS